jgi:hypothetical protein
MIIPTTQLANYLATKTQHDYRALYDINTKHLVVLSVFSSTLLALQSTNFDYMPITETISKYLQFAEYKSSSIKVEPENTNINFAIPWIYRLNGSRWEKTAIDTLPQDIVDKYYFTQQKAVVLDNIYAALDNTFNMSTANNYLQDTIYSIKYKQAKDVLAELVDPIKDPSSCSMVANYAELMNLSLIEAANNIIIQHKLYMDLLAHQEHFRLKFIKQVKDADSLDELLLVNNNLIKETAWYYQG